MLAHELRTPLGPVLLGLGELREDERFLEARPTLAMIQRNVELQARLLEELFDFTTLGQQKLRLRPNLVDVHEAVRQVLEICAGQMKAARIKIRLQFGATDSTVLADSMRLQQVLWNLLTNAIKFSFAGGAVTIATASEPDGHIAIDFIDLGIGIEPQLLPLIFEPFKQGDHHHGGLGLGLFIAKGIAEAQRGTLTVASGGLNRGTTFRLKFRAVSPLQPHLPEPVTSYE
jgi:signal transduction histidine kinase